MSSAFVAFCRYLVALVSKLLEGKLILIAASFAARREPVRLIHAYNRAMVKRLRIFLVWLMMLTIPTQGFAAATMLYCGPNDQRSTAGFEAASPERRDDALAGRRVVPDVKHVHSSHGVHDHAFAVAQREAAEAVADQAASGGVLEQTSGTTCSVCAVRCSATAVVASPPVIPALSVSSALIPTVSESSVSFFTNGPKRPPRPFLA